MNTKSKRYIVSGIDTGAGKTVVSAVLCEALQANYWKPVQAGDLDASDSITVRQLISEELVCFPEAQQLQFPMSPNLSAEKEGFVIDPSTWEVPQSDRSLIIEGAGGLLVPINDELLLIDVFKQFDAPIILVSKNYLGSINHTLLSVQAIRNAGLELAGIIFNGEADEAIERSILTHAKTQFLGRIEVLNELNKSAIKSAGENLSATLALSF